MLLTGLTMMALANPLIDSHWELASYQDPFTDRFATVTGTFDENMGGVAILCSQPKRSIRALFFVPRNLLDSELSSTEVKYRAGQNSLVQEEWNVNTGNLVIAEAPNDSVPEIIELLSLESSITFQVNSSSNYYRSTLDTSQSNESLEALVTVCQKDQLEPNDLYGKSDESLSNESTESAISALFELSRTMKSHRDTIKRQEAEAQVKASVAKMLRERELESAKVQPVLELLKKRVQERWYPPENEPITSEIVVSISFNDNGEIDSVRTINKSSGSSSEFADSVSNVFKKFPKIPEIKKLVKDNPHFLERFFDGIQFKFKKT